jgi:hypothetical protein
MRKFHLSAIVILLFLSLNAAAQDINLSPAQYQLQLPEGNVAFTLDQKKLIVKFRDDLPEFEMRRFFRNSSLFVPFNINWQVPFPKVLRVELAKGVDYNVAAGELARNKDVIYTAPVLKYNDICLRSVLCKSCECCTTGTARSTGCAIELYCRKSGR